jgi:hypothetical protein
LKKLLWIVCVVAVIVLGKRWIDGDTPLSLVSVEVKNPYAPTSPLHPASQRFVDGINADPRLKSRFAGVFTRRGLYSEVSTALKRGAKSLDGPVLVGATTAMARALPHLDTHSCAQSLRERDTFDEALSAKMRGAFEQISPRHHAALMDFYLQALAAEVGDAPERPLDEAALRVALNNLGSQYQGVFAERFVNAMRDKASAADEDLCWAGKTVLHGVTLMGDRDREVLSRWAISGG